MLEMIETIVLSLPTSDHRVFVEKKDEKWIENAPSCPPVVGCGKCSDI